MFQIKNVRNLKMIASCDVTPCSLVDINRCFLRNLMPHSCGKTNKPIGQKESVIWNKLQAKLSTMASCGPERKSADKYQTARR